MEDPKELLVVAEWEFSEISSTTFLVQPGTSMPDFPENSTDGGWAGSNRAEEEEISKPSTEECVFEAHFYTQSRT